MKQNKTPYLTKFAKMQKTAGIYSKLVKNLLAAPPQFINKGTLKYISEVKPNLFTKEVKLSPEENYRLLSEGLKKYTDRLIRSGKHNIFRLHELAENIDRGKEYWRLVPKGDKFLAENYTRLRNILQKGYGEPGTLTYAAIPDEMESKLRGIGYINKLVQKYPKYKSILPFLDSWKS